MASVLFVTHDGNEIQTDVPAGNTLMEGAQNAGIDSILAECGGAMSCATCHVYVDEAWVDKVEAPSGMEQDMLFVVANPKENSRLSCQVTVTDEMDGIKVVIPESQF